MENTCSVCNKNQAQDKSILGEYLCNQCFESEYIEDNGMIGKKYKEDLRHAKKALKVTAVECHASWLKEIENIKKKIKRLENK